MPHGFCKCATLSKSGSILSAATTISNSKNAADAVADEKAQKTLGGQDGQVSFKLVSERPEQVYKGLGEMQTVAAGVGDLESALKM